jgi:hypothetical protein
VSKEELLDATIKENSALQRLLDEHIKQLNEQSEEIVMLKRLFINS